MACRIENNEILEGYSKDKEYYSEGFQDYIEYCKYFYSEANGELGAIV